MRVTLHTPRDTRQTTRFLVRDGLRPATRRGIRQGLFSFGDDFIRTVNNSTLRQPKTGRVYLRRGPGGRRRRHQASAPGEAHANFSGTLRKSADYKIGGMTEIRVGYLDGEPDYAGFVEFGTRRMRPRPTVQRSIRENLINGANALEREISRAWEQGYR